MRKQLVVNAKKCLGCGICEQVCALVKTGTLNPEQSAVTVISYEQEEFAVPLVCQQCDEAPCTRICPVGALAHGEDGVVACDEKKCIVCRLCADACPMGNMRYSAPTGKMSKCTHCEGDPKCVSFCPAFAIDYTLDDATAERKRTIADMIKSVYQTDITL